MIIAFLLLVSLGQQLPQDVVRAAIVRGTEAQAHADQIGVRLPGDGFTVAIRGPQNRIAFAAALEASRGRAFTAANVTAEMSAPDVYVLVVPTGPMQVGAGWRVAPPMQAVRVEAGRRRIAPTTLQHAPHVWVKDGARLSSVGLQATFADLPAGELQVVVTSDRGESVFHVTAAQRATIR